MNNIPPKFGVAGNSKIFFDEGFTTTMDAASWCAARGIEVFEYSFGRGVTLPSNTAEEIGKKFAAAGVAMSAHSPYYINFANTDFQMIEKSIGYVLQSLKKLKLFGGDRLVVHPASQGKQTREEAVALTKENLALLAQRLGEEGYGAYKICLETMGKFGQIGTVDEIIEFCSLSDSFYPCLDFGHINARGQGILKNAENYNTIIQKLLDSLPFYKVDAMHIHFSKIEYGEKGEIAHLTFADTKYGPEFRPLAEVLCKYGFSPYIISESAGTQAEDSMEMKQIYFDELAKKKF